MEFNKFNIYTYNANVGQSKILDEVDIYKQDLMRMTEYEDVKNFLLNKFGDFEGKKLINYPELNKHIYLYLDDTKVEFCALQNKKQYFGRGWMLVEIKDDQE